MKDRRQEREFNPISALTWMAASATALIVGLAALASPQPAEATPSYAQQTKLACGRCHVSPAGGGALTAFGKAYVANGHKVPSKGAKPGKTAGDATPVVPEAAPAAGSHMTIRGTATVFFTTSPGVSNHSATIECFNCGVFVDHFRP